MSGDFVIDGIEGHGTECWNASTGLLNWVVKVLSEKVEDRDLANQLSELEKGGYSYFALSFFEISKIEQIVEVIQKTLAREAEKEYSTGGLSFEGLELVRDLVDTVTRWRKIDKPESGE